MKVIKVQLEKTARTDLVCIACGGFRTEFAIAVDGGESNAGVHRACVDRVHIRRAASAPAEAADGQ